MNDTAKEKKKKFILKILFIVSIIIVSIVAAGTIFGTVDYIRVKNGKKPIFIYHDKNINSKDVLVATEYYGLGYKIVVCDKCIDEKIIFMPFYFGTYAWFIDDESKMDFEISIKERDQKAEDILQKELASSYIELGESVSYKIYSYGLEEIKITIDGKTYLLEEALEQKKITMLDIITQLHDEGHLYDGGTTIYRDTNLKKVAGGNLTIIKCKAVHIESNEGQLTPQYNKDYYIGDLSLEYEDSFCK